MVQVNHDEMCRVVFNAVNGGAGCGEREFAEVLRLLQIDFSDETLRHLFTRADRNRDGLLSPSEFKGLGDTYPRLLECLYYRIVDKQTYEAHCDAIDEAQRQLEEARQQQAAANDELNRRRQLTSDTENEMAMQAQALEEARKREAQARQLDEAERYDQMTDKQSSQVASALDQVAKGVCAEKKEQHYASISEEDIDRFAQRLIDEWHRKEGDVVDELITNLKAPETVRSKLAVLAEAARHLATSKGEAYPQRNRLELLVMALYTMAGPDIDAVLTYEGVPIYDERYPATWEAYTKEHSPNRNSAIFSAINWAMRIAADPKKQHEKEGKEAWEACCKWIKYICLLLALSSQEEPSVLPHGAELARGLAGLPQQVLDAHLAMRPTDTLHWPAASSCAFDRSVSEAYIRGDAANATKREGGSVLFLVSQAKWGIPLQKISKYPKESEMLLPPLAVLALERITTLDSLPNTPVMEMVAKGHRIPPAFADRVLEDAVRSSERLKSAMVAHAEGNVRDTQSELEKQRAKERQAAGDVLRADREVERQQKRVQTSAAEYQRAEDRLRELERLLEAQRAEVDKQSNHLLQSQQDLKDAETLRAAAASDQDRAKQNVQAAAEAVQEAEAELARVKAAKDGKRKQTATKLTEAQKETRQKEKDKSQADLKMRQLQEEEQKAKEAEERISKAVQDAMRNLHGLLEEAEALKRRRQSIDDEERPILEQEVRLVEQRLSLEEKEAKHRGDIRSFDEAWRPASPAVGARGGRTPAPGGTPKAGSATGDGGVGSGGGGYGGPPGGGGGSPPARTGAAGTGAGGGSAGGASGYSGGGGGYGGGYSNTGGGYGSGAGRASVGGYSGELPPPGSRPAASPATRETSPERRYTAGGPVYRSALGGSGGMGGGGIGSGGIGGAYSAGDRLSRESSPTGTEQHAEHLSPQRSQALPRRPQTQTFYITLLNTEDPVGLWWEGREGDEIWVQQVSEGGAAWRAGVRNNMRLISVDDVEIRGKEALQHSMKSLRAKGGAKLLLDISVAAPEPATISPHRAQVQQQQRTGAPFTFDDHRREPERLKTSPQRTGYYPSPASSAAPQPTYGSLTRPADADTGISPVERLRKDLGHPPPPTSTGESRYTPSMHQPQQQQQQPQQQQPASRQSDLDARLNALLAMKADGGPQAAVSPRSAPPTSGRSQSYVGRPADVRSSRPTTMPSPVPDRSRPASVAGPPPTTPNTASSTPATEESLERRIARLSAEVAASRERAGKPL